MSEPVGTRSKAIILMTSILMSLIVAEAGLRTLAPLPDPFAWSKTHRWAVPRYVPSVHPADFSQSFRPEAGLPGMTPEDKSFTTNNYGFRGDSLRIPKPEEEYRIFLVGGSTFECLYLDDTEEIGHLLQKELERSNSGSHSYRVYNAGKSGNRSYDYLALVVHRIVHLQPDLVVVFPGFNDFRRVRSERDYILPRDRVDPEGARMTAKQLLAYMATELQLGRYALGALGTAASDEQTVTYRSNYAELAENARSRPLAEEKPVVQLEPYARNLSSLAGIASARGFQLVFMTQPTTWGSEMDSALKNWHWMTSFGPGNLRYREADLSRAMGRYNETTRSVARQHGFPALLLHREMEKSAEHFYDDVHFNEAGAEFAARRLAEYLRTEGLAGPRSAMEAVAP